MIYTLNDFLNSELIPEIICLTEPMKYKERFVHAACVQELLIEGFARPGDLVLITAMECESIENGYYRIIHRAVSAGAAAIVFSITENDSGVPADMLRYANEEGMPLFTIPYYYHYSDIIEKVAQDIKKKELNIFSNLQNALFNCYFDSRTLQEAVKMISARLKASVRLLSDTNVVLAEEVYSEQEDNPPGQLTQESGSLEEIECKITVGDISFGTLSICLKDNSLVTLIDQDVMEHYFAVPLSLWFNRQSIEDVTKAHIRGDFVKNLATGHYSSRQEMIHIGKQLHFDLDLPYACVQMNVRPLSDRKTPKEYSLEFAQNVSRIEGLFINEGRTQNRRIMVYNSNARFVAYVEVKDDLRAGIESVIDSLDRQITAIFPLYRCLWGISDISTDTTDFPVLYRGAKLALHFCINSDGKLLRYYYRDVTQALILSLLSEDKRLQKEVEKTILPLVEYHETSGINLFGTLVEFLKNHCNKNQTARALHIHRQSLPYRLDKIEELTGLSLDDHSDLFVLETLARIYQQF
jgi:purine catabolism regulator